MRKIKLITISGTTLYEGLHASLNEAIEHAITHSINLDGINLCGAILCNINLDSMKIKNADFSGADLTGANMSEAEFTGCNFKGADLTQACFCYSNITACDFSESIFGATDISMAKLVSCAFSGLSVFNLNFYSAFSNTLLTYQYMNEIYYFDTQPIVIKSPKNHIVILDNNVISNRIQENIENSFALAPVILERKMMDNL